MLINLCSSSNVQTLAELLETVEASASTSMVFWLFALFFGILKNWRENLMFILAGNKYVINETLHIDFSHQVDATSISAVMHKQMLSFT